MRKVISILLILLGTSFAGQNSLPKYWIFFTDKDLHSAQDTTAALKNAEARLTGRSLARRAKSLSQDALVDWYDIPVSKNYIKSIEAYGVQIIHKSRWLNAVSIRANSAAIDKLVQLPFVKRISLVAVQRSPFRTTETPDYGLTERQLEISNIPALHRIKTFGYGVLLCITDTGFKFSHIATENAEVVAQYDFVCNDSIVDLEEGDNPSVISHGTRVWSEIAGRIPGTYWGVAPEASFLLARTEDVDSEWVGEEDNWAAAAEWADSIGADIISVSLGYYSWYTYDQMNGDSAIITIAADRAAYLGIAVFTAAGNSGGYRTLVAPGDGDSVITVGACDSYGTICGFASKGPTADGRLKPDIVTHGAGTYVADPYSDSLFYSCSGTSMATPIAAGIGALILQLRPSMTPMDLLNVLKMTANNTTTPDSAQGWGIIDACAAVAYPFNDTSIIILEAGWNIVALSVDSAIATDALPIVSPAYAYDDSIYIEVDTLIPGKGYFVLSLVDTFFTISGETIDDIEFEIAQGWNLIGGLSRRTFVTEIDEFPITPEFFMVSNNTYFISKSLIPGQGGWFFSLTDRTVHLLE